MKSVETPDGPSRQVAPVTVLASPSVRLSRTERDPHAETTSRGLGDDVAGPHVGFTVGREVDETTVETLRTGVPVTR